jgi:hypothetical protein
MASARILLRLPGAQRGLNPRLFAGKEEQSELAVSDDGGRHGMTVSERYLMPPVAGLVAWAVTGESYTGIKLGGAGAGAVCGHAPRPGARGGGADGLMATPGAEGIEPARAADFAVLVMNRRAEAAAA